MARPRNPTPPPVETPDETPFEEPTVEAEPSDVDPDLLDEPADGGGQPRRREVPLGQFPGMPNQDIWQQDPFRMVADAAGMRMEEPQQAVVPTPGSTRAVTEEDLVRKGMVEYPDEALVTVKLWEVNKAGIAGDPICVTHNVLYSVAKEPLTWIEHCGRWYMEIISSGKEKKKLAKKTFTTPGTPPPRNPDGSLAWRPRIEGDDMNPLELAKALRDLGIVVPQQPQPPMLPAGAYPAGAVPQHLYDNAATDLRAQIAELKAENKSLTKEREEAKDAKVDALRKMDLAERDLKQAEKENRDLRDRVRELETKIANAPRGDGKPEWFYVVDALKDQGKRAEEITLKDILKVLDARDSGRDSPDPFQALNSSLELVEKVRKTAGLPGSTPTDAAKSEEWTLEKVVGVADKVTDIVKRRQRMAEIEHGAASSSSSGGGAKREKTQAERDKEALEDTVEKLVTALRSQEDPDKLGRKLAAAVAWASELDMADADPEIKGFLTELYKNPAKLLPWYGAHQDPPIPEAYCLRVAVAFSQAINRPVEPAAPPKPEPARQKPQDAPQPPPAAEAAPQTKTGRPRRKPGRKPKAPKNGGQEAKAEEPTPETPETPLAEDEQPTEAAVQS